MRDVALADIETWYAATHRDIQARTGQPGVSTLNKTTPPLLDELRAYQDWVHGHDRLVVAKRLLFTTKCGRPMSQDNNRRDGWRKAVARAKLPPATMNSLRHSYQTIIAAAVPEAAFERLAGHVRGSTVGRRFYVHSSSLGPGHWSMRRFG